MFAEVVWQFPDSHRVPEKENRYDMDNLTPTELANTVSSFATIFSGLTGLLLCWLVASQPRRWVAVYGGMFLTGLPTLWYHGFGETYIQGWADTSSNLLLAWLVIVAALWDGYSREVRRWVAGASGAINLVVVILRLVGGSAFRHVDVVPLGAFGGFHITETVLILDSFLGVGLLYGRHAAIPTKARPLLYATTVVFVCGALLASASNHQLDLIIISYHAIWHIVGAFGFLLLWAFNHARWNLT
jgi:hypothetical protein